MNEKQIQQLKWQGKDQTITVSQGLSLRIRKSSKTYLIRKSVNGKQQVISLGKSPELSLKQAKLKAAELSQLQNINNFTIKELTEKYYREVVKNKQKAANQVRGYCNKINERLGTIKVLDVVTTDCTIFIQEYSHNNGARSSDRLRSYLKQVFSFGVELGYLINSPMINVTNRITGYTSIERERTILKNEIKMISNWTNPRKGWQKTEENKKVILFLLLTGLRISEAQKGYVDGDKFRIDDTKGKHKKHIKRPHWVFLTKSAKDLLPLPSCTSTNIQAWLKRKLISEDYNDIAKYNEKNEPNIKNRFTAHDARRTFATIANSNGIDTFVVERVLNHKLQGIMSTYNRATYEKERIEAALVVEKAFLDALKN